MGVITKSIGSWIGTNKVFESLHERFLTMFGTLPQGEMGILIAAYLFSRGLLSPSQFNLAVIVVVLLTMLSAIVMKVLIREKRGQATFPMKRNEGLRLLRGN